MRVLRGPGEIVPLRHGSLRRKHLHWHAVVLVEHAGILNPERKLRRTVLSDNFPVEDAPATRVP